MAGARRIDAGREALLHALQEAGVDFVLISGAAIQTQALRELQIRLDFCGHDSPPRRAPSSLDR